MNTLSYYNSLDLYSSITFGKHFSRLLGQLTKPEQTLIFLCIGSDRATGDSLGPIVGHKLKLQQSLHSYLVYGTLEEPVHAKNLETTMELIHRRHKNPFIIAIDASLGKRRPHRLLYTCRRLFKTRCRRWQKPAYRR